MGAGPAGLAAAITLARAGRRVVVHEACGEVGHRFRQDLQGLENWTTKADVLDEFKALGLTTEFKALACYRGVAYDPYGKPHRILSDEPVYYMVERGPRPGSLDSALLAQALERGVEVRFKSRLKDFHGDGIFAAGPKVTDALAVGYHFRTRLPDGFWIICDDQLAPKGYAYLLVMEGQGTVKSCMFAGFRERRRYVSRTVAAFRERVGLEMIDPRPHSGVGSFLIPTTARCGRHPVAGEQAGFQDYLWGFGIRIAIQSGILAARSLIEGTDYDALWRRELAPQMRISLTNRAIFSLLGRRGYRLFLQYQARQRHVRRFLHGHYQPSSVKRLLYPWAQRRYGDQVAPLNCPNYPPVALSDRA